jgi:hypothetical protein
VRRLWVLFVVVVAAGCTGPPPSPPTPAATPSASTDAVVAELLARPMRLPAVAPGATCPVSQPTRHAPVAQPGDADGLGTAPVWPMTGGNLDIDYGGAPARTPGPDGLYEIKVVWASDGTRPGPAVVRVGRLDGPGRGVVRLYYDQGASRGDAVVFQVLTVPQDWPSGTFVSGPGCYAYQADWAGGTEVLVFRVSRTAG